MIFGLVCFISWKYKLSDDFKKKVKASVWFSFRSKPDPHVNVNVSNQGQTQEVQRLNAWLSTDETQMSDQTKEQLSDRWLGIAMGLRKQGDREGAKSFATASAQKGGNTAAKVLLGQLALEKEPADHQLAFHWFREAVQDQGGSNVESLQALFFMGQMFHFGVHPGLPEDLYLANHIYSKLDELLSNAPRNHPLIQAIEPEFRKRHKEIQGDMAGTYFYQPSTTPFTNTVQNMIENITTPPVHGSATQDIDRIATRYNNAMFGLDQVQEAAIDVFIHTDQAGFGQSQSVHDHQVQEIARLKVDQLKSETSQDNGLRDHELNLADAVEILKSGIDPHFIQQKWSDIKKVLDKIRLMTTPHSKYNMSGREIFCRQIQKLSSLSKQNPSLKPNLHLALANALLDSIEYDEVVCDTGICTRIIDSFSGIVDGETPLVTGAILRSEATFKAQQLLKDKLRESPEHIRLIYDGKREEDDLFRNWIIQTKNDIKKVFEKDFDKLSEKEISEILVAVE